MEAITIRTDNKFKSAILNTETMRLFKAFQNIETGRKEACKVLARVEKNKSYTDDGFNSLAEYAEKIGLEKSLAHKMENAGRMLVSEDETIKSFAEKADYSKLAILSSADEKEVKKAIEEGTLTNETTQADVKKWKANAKPKEGKAKVLPNYEVHITFGNGDSKDYESIALEAVEDFDGFVKTGTYQPENGDKITFMYNPSNGKMLRYTAVKVVEKKQPKKPAVINVKNFSDEQIQALIEEYKRRQSEKVEAGE